MSHRYEILLLLLVIDLHIFDSQINGFFIEVHFIFGLTFLFYFLFFKIDGFISDFLNNWNHTFSVNFDSDILR